MTRVSDWQLATDNYCLPSTGSCELPAGCCPLPVVGCFVFVRRSSTLQELLIHVGTPRRGRSHACRKTQTARNASGQR